MHINQKFYYTIIATADVKLLLLSIKVILNTRGGQSCSKKESLAENHEHQQASKLVNIGRY